MEKGGQLYYFHADGLGSIVKMTDGTGKAAQAYEYDSFGKLHDKMNAIKQPYAFTGRERDKDTGLYYYRARYYDAEVGRFTSFDPIVHPIKAPAVKGCGNNISSSALVSLLNKPSELNPYVYGLDNPINNVDPYGKFILIPFLPSTFSPYPLLSPSEENCSHYKKDCDECGNRIACAAYDFCTRSFDTIWFNCVRGCLKEKYLNRSNDYIWLFVDHPVCYAACPPM